MVCVKVEEARPLLYTSPYSYVDEHSVTLFFFMETRIKEQDSYSNLDIDGFGEYYHLDRDQTVTGKPLGGGLCLC